MNDTIKSARTIDVDVRVRLPVSTPMIDWAAAMTALSETLGGTWSYRAAPGLPRGRFEIEVLPEVQP